MPQGLLAGRKSDKRFLAWQFAVPQQIGHFLEGAIAGKLLDGIAAVGQRVGLRNDLGHGSLIDDDAIQALADFGGLILIGHGVNSP